MTECPLQKPLQFVKGVGPHRAALLSKLGLETVADLLYLVPRDVLDLSRVTPVQKLQPEQTQTVFGQVIEIDSRELGGRRSVQAILVDCEGQIVKAIWFNQPWVLKRFHTGQSLLVSGKPKLRAGRWEFAHPHIQPLEVDPGDATGRVLPIYPLTDGLKMYELRRLAAQISTDYTVHLTDRLPSSLQAQLEIGGLHDAVRQLHQPESAEAFERARRRIVLEELLEFQLGVALRRRFWKRDAVAPKLANSQRIDSRIRKLFPYRLTSGQDAAIRDMVEDMNSERCMHRLLQADVGAGKTAVAIYGMLVAVAAGHQAVLMAPTEILAQQHWDTIDELLCESRVERALLTGNLKAAERRELLPRIRSGDVQLVVGTQAVIQSDVEFARLGLAVIDEQHKFGVMQRAHFARSDQHPHILVMTATPIPRSVCLTLFGDLDVSLITEQPAGRQPVVTSRVDSPRVRSRAWQFIREQLTAGRQAYVVCPRVQTEEEDSEAALASVEQISNELQSGELSGFRIAVAHGRQDRNQRQSIMDQFRQHEFDVLVATTVIEVGVDVPNATLMWIYNADRFGLSQLHQLRGRVGRGSFQGYCLLETHDESNEAAQRLDVLVKSSDGFEIAEADFSIRGPGDVLGTRQHGRLPLNAADLRKDAQLLQLAHQTANQLVATDALDEPDFGPLKQHVLQTYSEIMELPRTG